MMKILLFALALLTPVTGAVAQPLSPSTELPATIGTTITFRSAIMEADRTINIYLPADYTRETERRYPVLYVIDGGLAQDFHHISGLAQLGGLSGMYPDMIVVGIETRDRRNELTSPAQGAAYQRQFPTSGGGARFRSMIADEVMPYISATYRTSDRRVVIGESLAAFFVVDIFLNHPATFTDYIAISPSMWWDDMRLADAATGLLAAHTPAARSFYLTVADEGGNHLRGTERLAAAIGAQGPAQLRFTYEPRPTEQHSTIYHGAALAALRWIFQETPRP